MQAVHLLCHRQVNVVLRDSPSFSLEYGIKQSTFWVGPPALLRRTFNIFQPHVVPLLPCPDW